MRKVLNSSRAWSASSVHLNLSELFSSFEECQALLPKFADEAT
jgi:hypothetical protein